MGKTCDLGDFEHDMIADAGRGSSSSSSQGIFKYGDLNLNNFGSINIQLVEDLWIKVTGGNSEDNSSSVMCRRPFQDTRRKKLRQQTTLWPQTPFFKSITSLIWSNIVSRGIQHYCMMEFRGQSWSYPIKQYLKTSYWCISAMEWAD